MSYSTKLAATAALGSILANAATIYDAKALIINARLADCTVSSSTLDTCIDDWADTYDSYSRPDSSSITRTERTAFTDNIAAVIDLNSKGNLTWVADLNAFSHWNLTTFSERYLAGNLTLPLADSVNFRIERRALKHAAAVDWSAVTLNGSTPLADVKDQGELGVSWAFAAVGALEAVVAISSNGTDSATLSEQFTISGTDDLYKNMTVNSSCSGGSTWDALLFASSHGIALDSDFPYTDTCPSVSIDFSTAFYGTKSLREPVAIYAPQGNYSTAAMTRLAIQPVTVFTRIGIQSLMLYSEGLFTEVDECTQGIDQALLLVGYNSTEGSYKLKNSWGAGWGESGFIRFAMNNNTQGPCNILSNMYYPSMAYESGVIGEIACPVSGDFNASTTSVSRTTAAAHSTIVRSKHSHSHHSASSASLMTSTKIIASVATSSSVVASGAHGSMVSSTIVASVTSKKTHTHVEASSTETVSEPTSTLETESKSSTIKASTQTSSKKASMSSSAVSTVSSSMTKSTESASAASTESESESSSKKSTSTSATRKTTTAATKSLSIGVDPHTTASLNKRDLNIEVFGEQTTSMIQFTSMETMPSYTVIQTDLPSMTSVIIVASVTGMASDNVISSSTFDAFSMIDVSGESSIESIVPTSTADLVIEVFGAETQTSMISYFTAVATPLQSQTSVMIVASISPVSSIVSQAFVPSNTFAGSSFTRSMSKSTASSHIQKTGMFFETLALKRRELINSENHFFGNHKSQTLSSTSQVSSSHHASFKHSTHSEASTTHSMVETDLPVSLFKRKHNMITSVYTPVAHPSPIYDTSVVRGEVHITFEPKPTHTSKLTHFTGSFSRQAYATHSMMHTRGVMMHEQAKNADEDLFMQTMAHHVNARPTHSAHPVAHHSSMHRSNVSHHTMPTHSAKHLTVSAHSSGASHHSMQTHSAKHLSESVHSSQHSSTKTALPTAN